MFLSINTLMESGVVLQPEARLPSENIAIQDKDHVVASSALISIVPQQPGTFAELVISAYIDYL